MLSLYYYVSDSLCYCNDVCGLFDQIRILYEPSEWRLFVDSSSVSLKAVLLHNGNRLSSIPVAHSTHMEENYQNVKVLLEKINYEAHQWDVVGDFKVICFLLGQQGGFAKYSFFLCLVELQTFTTPRKYGLIAMT